MRSSAPAALAALLACGVGPGCSPQVAAATCDENTDCATGELCVAGACRVVGGEGEGEGEGEGGEGEGEGEGEPPITLRVGVRSGVETATGGGFILRAGPAGTDVPVTVRGSRFTLRPQLGGAR